MAKVRVHELAKELDIQSKDIIKFLEEKNITGKVANSSIEDDVISMVKEKFSGKTEKTAETKETKETNKEENKDKKAAERPKKKSSITAVFNPQNSKTAPKRSQQGGRQDGNRQQHSQNDQRQKQDGNRQQRPQGQNGDGNRQQRPQGQNGDENRQQRPQNDQRQRQDGNRQRPQGDDQRQDGNRQQRPQNDQRQRQDGNRQQRPQNDQRQRQDGNRQRPQGDRNNNRNGQNRSNNSKNRFEQEISKLNQNSPVPAVEERGKESRERENRKNNNQRHEKDIMGKKQERFDNLEKSTKKKKQQPAPQPQQKEEDTIKTITLPEKMTIKELADRMKVQASVIIKKLFLQGNMVTVNSEITFEEAEEIALEFNCICEMEEKVDVIAELLKEDDEDEANMVKRPPVVCVMGHVDHGKTSLLDAIRDTHVIDREAGGITQHIGAYMVECNGEKITFLDTPGHEAFTAMRMRGANSTDIAILVVAADDGVMPQTVEAISHAKAAGVEIIVAVNKMDKPSANIERVKQELAEYELIPEDWGGSTIFVPVSARTHEGIEQLLEMILLTAEICELKANPKRNARGVVIEAQLDKGRGSVATVLVQKGTLKVGQPIACGSCYGKVRAMIDDKGRRVKEAGPSTPVEILGLNNVPNAGEIFVCTDSEKEAKSFADTFISEGREKMQNVTG